MNTYVSKNSSSDKNIELQKDQLEQLSLKLKKLKEKLAQHKKSI